MNSPNIHGLRGHPEKRNNLPAKLLLVRLENLDSALERRYGLIFDFSTIAFIEQREEGVGLLKEIVNDLKWMWS